MNKNTRSSLPAFLRAVSLMLTLALLLSLLPAAMATTAGAQYGYVNHDEVRFRREANSTVVWARLDTGWVCEITGTKTSGGVVYYQVTTSIPSHPERDYNGYINKDYITIMTQAEVDAWVAAGGNTPDSGASQSPATGTQAPAAATQTPSGSTQTAAPSASYTNFARANNTSTNFYSYNGTVLISQGLLSPSDAYYINRTETIDGTAYYVILYNGTDERYVKASNMTLLTSADLSGGSTGGSGSTGGGTTATNTPAPSTGTPQGGIAGYVKITPKGSTNIRKAPVTGKNNRVAQAEQGDILPYYSTLVENKETWFYVYYAPENVYGYVLGECCQAVDASGNTPAPGATNPPATVTNTPAPSTSAGFVVLTYGGVNLRSGAGKRYNSIRQYDKDEVFPYISVTNADGVTWYEVITEDGMGFFHGDYCKPCDANGNIVTSTPTPGGSVVTQGYLYTTKEKVYLRKKASTAGGYYSQIKDKNTVLPIVGATVKNGNYYWYYVSYNGDNGYLRSDCIAVMSQEQINGYLGSGQIPTPTPTPTPAPKPTEYIMTTVDKVWVRKSPSTNVGTNGQVKIGFVTKYLSKTTVGGALWYKIDYGGIESYIKGSCVRVLTDAEYNQYVGSLPTPTPTPSPSPKPDPATLSNIAITLKEKVIVRATGNANGKQVTLLYRTAQVCTLTGTTADSGGYTWYNLKVNGVTGWIRGDLLRVLTKEEAEVYNKTGDPDAKPEASYSSLKEGSSGDAVTKLQNRLAVLGYMTQAQVTGYYDSITKDAVKRYQEANDLTVDGIAGSATQHALYGTVETGYYETNSGSSTTVKLYKPELIDWYTGGIQNIFYKGAVATLTDVKTGISFKVKRWSGGLHADVEPYTAADTAAMCKIYGVKTAQDISDKNLYQRHPVLITIGTHSYCASMFGMPHNYPEGDTIDDNDFYGQFCVHFVNSKIHKSGKVDSDHQAAIMYAYQNAAKLLNIN